MFQQFNVWSRVSNLALGLSLQVAELNPTDCSPNGGYEVIARRSACSAIFHKLASSATPLSSNHRHLRRPRLRLNGHCKPLFPLYLKVDPRLSKPQQYDTIYTTSCESHKKSGLEAKVMKPKNELTAIGLILYIPSLFIIAEPAMAQTCDYSITQYRTPMSRTVRTYTVSSPTTYRTYVQTPAPTTVRRVIANPVLVETPTAVAPVFVEKTIQQPVLLQQSTPLRVERTTTTPVVIENKPVKVKKDSHHLINVGVWPLKLKVL